MATNVSIVINSVECRTRIRLKSLTYKDVINDAPNSCTFEMAGTRPTELQTVRITVGGTYQFNGTIQLIEDFYEGKSHSNAYRVTVADDLAKLNKVRPFGAWTSTSASTIAAALISSYASGFTSTNVAASLPSVSIIFNGSETFSECLGRLAKAIGGYYYVEDGDLHLFLTEASSTPDTIDTTAGRFLESPPIRMTKDVSQLRTRVYGRGHGEATRVDVAASATTIPVGNAAWFASGGGKAITDNMVLTYTGRDLGTGASVVTGDDSPAAPGALTNALPSPLVTGALGNGVYKYKVSYLTASGETAAGTASSGTTVGAISIGGSAAAVDSYTTGGALTPSTNYAYKATLVTARGEGTTNTSFNATTGGSDTAINIKTFNYADARIIGVNIYRQVTGGSQYYLLTMIAGPNVIYTDVTADSGLSGKDTPAVSTMEGGAVALSSIPTSGDGRVIGRVIYRTKVGGSTYFKLTTIGDNSTTTFVDTKADTDLGDAAASASTIAVPVAKTSLPVADLSVFASAGWVIVGSQMIRYTGRSASSGAGTLTGVPSSSTGSILAAISSGATVTQSPMITGVTGNGSAITAGALLNIWVQRDDATAQSTYGVVEYTVVDERRDETSLTALCDANLTLYKAPIVTVVYACRDIKTKSGKSVTFNLTNPAITQTLIIQEVTTTEVDAYEVSLNPRFTVKASSVRYSLDDLLRRLLAASATGAAA